MPLKKPREGDSFGFHVYSAVQDEGTLGEPEAVIWSSIRHLCSQGVAEEIVRRVHGVTKKRDRESVAWSLKLYVRHASEFYDAARAAKANTAPLIYYYSFLNLAKAMCELRYPIFHRRPECYKHGLSWRPNPRKVADPARETVSITTRGVWHVLWEALMGRPCPAANPTVIPIRRLFCYCPEVSVEAYQAFGRSLNLIYLIGPDVLYTEKSREAWIRFSVSRAILKRLSVSAPNMIGQISTSRSSYEEVQSGDRTIRTFQSTVSRKVRRREDPMIAMHSDVKAFMAYVNPGREGNLEYSIPIQKWFPMPIPQTLVTYTILFWLGSLVRYDPHSVDRLMDSRYWMLIDGFMNQSRLWLLELFEWAFYKAETTLWVSR